MMGMAFGFGLLRCKILPPSKRNSRFVNMIPRNKHRSSTGTFDLWCGSALTLAKVGESTARGMGWMSLASLPGIEKGFVTGPSFDSAREGCG